MNVRLPKSGKFELIFVAVVMILTLNGCGKEIELVGFSKAAWKSDPNGCNGQRRENIEALLKAKDRLLNMPEQDILALLGRPDKNELHRRSRKFFVYYIDPSPACNNNIPERDPVRYLSVRINAVGIVSEVYLYN